MSDLRFAVIGTGFWANYQIPAWFEVGGVQLVALYNRTVAKAEALAQKYDVPRVYGDAEEMLRNERLDFVDIITEVPAHEPMVLLAARYRVPVICQKPMAPDFDTACRMVRACQDAGVPFLIHENFRWQSTLRALKGILEAGTIGEPYRARLSFVFYNAKTFENQPFLKEVPRLALPDAGSHLLDLARFFFGEPESLYCQIHRTRDDIAGEDVATVMLKIGHLACTCELSYSTRTEWGHFPETFAYIEGTQGSIEVSADYWIRVTTDDGTLSRRYPPARYAWADPMYDIAHASIVPCNANLLQALRTGEPAETNGLDNLRTMRLVYKAYESAENNQVINLDYGDCFKL
jgi:D-apiose dehydrogenase